MKFTHVLALSWLSGALICGSDIGMAQDKVPCLILTGHSDTPHNIDLSKHNRITFEPSGLAISSSNDETGIVRFSYSQFHHLEVGDAIPTDPVSITEISTEGPTRLTFLPTSKSISLESVATDCFNISIFNTTGSLFATTQMLGGQTVSVSSLPPGVYIAAATNHLTSLTLKFIIN